VLVERLSTLRSEPLEKSNGKVFVGTPGEAAGRSFERVFLPGLAEGLFPAKVLEDPLLLDAARKEVSPQLPLLTDQIEEERRLLHVALAVASRQFVASFPRQDHGQGRARVPSLYALELVRAAEGRLPDLQVLDAPLRPSLAAWAGRRLKTRPPPSTPPSLTCRCWTAFLPPAPT